MDFFYDRQIERYLLQFIRIFSDIKIQLDEDSNGVKIQKRVPIQYGDMSRTVAHILKDGNQNMMIPSPFMSATIKSLSINDKRRADPTNVSPMHGTEKSYNELTGKYEPVAGNKYTVERYMPVPYDIEFNLDILTSNTQTKLQILEQILTIFNPGIQLQHTDNPFDWSSIFEITLKNITWSNRNIPVGADLKDDVASLVFTCEIWISPAAKLKRQRLIENVYTNFVMVPSLVDANAPIEDFLNSQTFLRLILSSDSHMIDVSVNNLNQVEVTLLNKYGADDETLTWASLIEKRGIIVDGVTTLRLKLNDDLDNEEGDIYGFIHEHPTASNKLLFEVDEDTLPSTTLPFISSIINAITMYPTKGLPPAANGQRYMLISDHTNGEEEAIANSPVWGDLTSNEYDIIEHNGTGWLVSFDSKKEQSIQYIKNIKDGQHYKFNPATHTWIYTYLGRYNIGYWSIDNLSPIPTP
jgi:hypothetical protein